MHSQVDHPKDSKVSNVELVHSYNQYVENFNNNNKNLIEDGSVTAMEFSSVIYCFLVFTSIYNIYIYIYRYKGIFRYK